MFTISSAFYDGFAKERFESLFLISNDSAGIKTLGRGQHVFCRLRVELAFYGLFLIGIYNTSLENILPVFLLITRASLLKFQYFTVHFISQMSHLYQLMHLF